MACSEELYVFAGSAVRDDLHATLAGPKRLHLCASVVSYDAIGLLRKLDEAIQEGIYGCSKNP
jgi:hypothetical protein